jgi:hypothetical protein
VGNILRLAGDKVVHADHGVTLRQQTVAQVGTQESGRAGD